MAIDRISHCVLVLKIAMWCDALRALWSAVMTPCPRHLQLVIRLSWPAATSVVVVASRHRFFPAGGVSVILVA